MTTTAAHAIRETITAALHHIVTNDHITRRRIEQGELASPLTVTSYDFDSIDTIWVGENSDRAVASIYSYVYLVDAHGTTHTITADTTLGATLSAILADLHPKIEITIS